MLKLVKYEHKMIQKDARNTLHHTWDANKSKYTGGERSLGTLVTQGLQSCLLQKEEHTHNGVFT